MTGEDELSDAVLEILSRDSLTLPQLAETVKRLPKWKRTDQRAVRVVVQKLEADYRVMHERDGGAMRYRWLSPADAKLIGERNEREQRAREEMRRLDHWQLVREAIFVAMKADGLTLIRNSSLAPLPLDETEAAVGRIAHAVVLHCKIADR